jgi:Na+-transporting NADH:ubiquinone oxidoreductase subunit B
MLRKFLDFQLSLTEKGKPLHKLRSLVSATDTFLYEAPVNTTKGPHIRDAIDLKRWMVLVVLSLLPCIFMAIWNTGLLGVVYSSGNHKLMDEYIAASGSLSAYFDFAAKDNRWIEFLKYGFMAFVPVVLISYLVGGIWEAIFAQVRGHEIAEGFLVTGILYPLILPPTIPYWMVAVGVSAGVVLSKELFGGTGMNIMNPALVCRAFLFFTFPGKMSGDVWVGTNPTVVRESLIKMNQEAKTTALDSYTQASKLAQYNITSDIKKIHVDALASNNLGQNVDNYSALEQQFTKWNANGDATLGQLSSDQLRQFVTTPIAENGLGLSSGNFEDASHFSALKYGIGNTNSDGGFFFGNKIGSMGETSILACLLGAFFLIYTGVGSWRTMLAMGIGAYLTAFLFEFGAKFFGADGGAWTPAQFTFPAYKHLLLGGLAFGLVFMITDPVSSPSIPSAQWVYGLFVGLITIVIREINPAYPEAVMLAIIMGNVFAPLFDYYAARNYRRLRRGTA